MAADKKAGTHKIVPFMMLKKPWQAAAQEAEDEDDGLDPPSCVIAEKSFEWQAFTLLAEAGALLKRMLFLAVPGSCDLY